MSTTADNARQEPVIAPLSERDLPEAERIFRVAFGTFLGVPDPETFWADRDYVYGRWRAPHVTAFGASIDGNLVGSNFATKWGSVGFFGPVTIRPDLQERGIAGVYYLARHGSELLKNIYDSIHTDCLDHQILEL